MKKIFSLMIALAFMAPKMAKADEGMWLPMFVKRLNYVDMQKEGLKLTPEEIYSINNSSLKDAIVNFGGYCTGEVISSQGLILTNHHCGYGAIAELSTEENDYLTDGFWAYSKEEELKPNRLFVAFLVKMEDVTDKMQAVLSDEMSEEQRNAKIAEYSKTLAEQATKGTNYRARVKSFFKGNEFYMFTYQDYTDVRLVGAPPSSIGKYGGDTDNWMWPRHTGDFSMFRVYADADGNPAEYSKENIPLKPKHHLKMNLRDKKEGDFAMIMGYPGRTERYLPSWGVEQAIEMEYPAWVEASAVTLDIMKKYMKASDKVRLDYASKFASTANYWKNRIGMIEALTKLKTIEKKQALEKDFSDWVNSDDQRKEQYGETLGLFKEYYTKTNEYSAANTYLGRGLMRGSSFIRFVGSMKDALKKYEESEDTERDKMRPMLESRINSFFESNKLELEREVMISQLNLYSKKVSSEFKSKYFVKLEKKNKGDFSEFVNDLFEESIFTSKERLNKFLARPRSRKLRKDDFGEFVSEMNSFSKEMRDKYQVYNDLEQRAYRLFVAGLREMNPDKAYYPDANFTMRLTYGQILPYQARDAVKYKYITTIEGVMQKMDNSNPEFVVPDKLVELYKAKDYGQYANSKGELVVGFLSNNDITGGNSGSPVIDGEGHLIGTAFDGNWEAMSGDIEFEQNMQRTISVDIRYTLFIVDKFAGATNIIEELDIIK
jgi:hypothetical protein